MQTFLELVQKRQSVRKFTDAPVDRTLLKQCVQAAHLAPSANNVQPWRYVIVDDPAIKQRLQDKAFSGLFRATRWAMAAPVLVVICAELDMVTNRIGRHVTGLPYYLIDIGISGEHFALQAAELGLGSCWIGWFNSRGAKRALRLRTWKPVSILAVGWPAVAKIRNKKRNPLEKVLHFNRVNDEAS